MNSSIQKVALVTGASRGIGAAVAKRLAKENFAIAVNFAHGAEDAAAVVAQITSAGGNAVAIRADVSNRAEVVRLFDETQQTLGQLSAVINNAGIMRLCPIADMDDALFDQTVAINLKGVFNCMREAVRCLPAGGRIISFSSSVVGVYGPTYGAYAASKAAVEAMSHVLSKELGPRKINVNVVAPGPTATDLFLRDKREEQLAGIVRMIPFGRLGEPSDIADVVAFLVGPDSSWVTGQVLRANGGMI